MTVSVEAGYKGCCGFVEIYGFEDNNSGSYRAEDFKGLLARVSEVYQEGQVFHIWFVKEADYDGNIDDDAEWGWAELRKLVKAIPDVIRIGKFINPNSHNMIDGYAWVNKKGTKE